MGSNSFTSSFEKIPKALFLFLALVFCFEWAVCYFNRVPDYALKKELIETERIEAEVLFLGDSSATSNVDAALFEEKTGLAMYGLGTLQWLGMPSYYLLFQDYLQHQPAPRYLILMVTPETWTGDFGKRYSMYFEAYFSRSPLLFKILGQGLSPTLFFHYAVLDWLPSIRYRSYLQDVLFPDRRALLHKEFAHMSGARKDLISRKGTSLMEKGSQGFECFPPSKSYTANPVQLRYARKILALAESRGIPVFYVAAPFARECYTEAQVAELQAIHGEVLEKNPGLEFIHILDLPLPKENFSNTSFHLHRGAARIFTEKLAEFLVKALKHPAGG